MLIESTKANDTPLTVENWTAPVSWWGKQFKVSPALITLRVKMGMDEVNAIFGPAKNLRQPRRPLFRIGAQDKHLRDWAGLTAQKPEVIEKRLKAGASIVEAVFGQ